MAGRTRNLIGMVLALLASPVAVRAQAVFGPPLNISQSADNAYVPSLVVEQAGPGAGEAHAFWHDFTSAPNLVWCASTAGGAWQPAGACPPNVTASWSPRAALAPDGAIHLAWRDRTGGQDDIWHARWDGLSFSPPANISLTAGRSQSPTITVDPGGNPHVMWEDDTTGAVRFWEAHHDGAVWSAAADTGLPFQQGAFLDTIRVVSNASGTLHAVWHDGPDALTEIYHATRPPGGTWNLPELVAATPAALSAEPAVAIAPDDTVHCAWVEQDPLSASVFEIVHSSKAPRGVWMTPTNVSRQGGWTWRPSVAVGADGVARIAWGFDDAGVGETYFAGFPGDVPVNVSRSPTDRSERASLALDPAGEPLIAWQERVGTVFEIFVSGTEVTPPDLRVTKDEVPGDVLLTWTGGVSPYLVFRAEAPDPDAAWVELTPVLGTPDTRWTDAGVLRDGRLLHYLVE